MHELSIAMSLLDVAEEQGEKLGGAEIVAIHVKVGPLSGVIKDALLSAFDMARQGTSLEHADLLIEETDIMIRCPTCGQDRPATSVSEMRCVECGSLPSEIVGGRELEITALEIET